VVRRNLAIIPALALLFGVMVGVVPASPAGATDAVTVWKLVERTCKSNETPAGKACFDPAGHAQDYNSVSSEAADGKTNGEHNSYTYRMPDTIAVGQNNQVQLTADVDQITDGGAHSRICLNVYGQFSKTDDDEPCATTAETPNGQEASASRTITLEPSNGVSGTIITLTIGFEEPGGYVNYDYKATNPRTHVNFSFTGRDHRHEGGGRYSAITVTGDGAFDVLGPTQPTMDSDSNSDAQHGSATVRLRRSSGTTRIADLRFQRAIYHPMKHSATLIFRVTRSQLTCLPKSRKVDFHAVDKATLEFDFCGFSPLLRVDSPNDDTSVTVKPAR
jgi:hypothetical protein